MSFWDDFIGSFKQTKPGGRNFIGDATVGLFNAVKATPGMVVNKTLIEPAARGIENEAAKAGYSPEDVDAAGGVIRKSAVGKIAAKEDQKFVQETFKAFDPVLVAADKAERYVFSPLIARPISTAFLLTDPTSPLYTSDKRGEGFQLSDITDAYKRSEKVSLGVAMTKSAINPLASITAPLLENGGVDIDKVNLWNDEDVKKNFEDNVTGRWITGGSDFVIKNVAIGGVISGAAALVKAGAIRNGLNTSLKVGDIEAYPQLEKLARDHIDYVKSNGATGVQSNFGEDVVNIANSDDFFYIKTLTEKHSNNDRLFNLFKETTDPDFVLDSLLADKGYGPAIDRLVAARRSDDLWYAADGTTELQGAFISTGKIPVYTAEQRQRWMAAFDDAIAKEPKHQEIFDSFLKQVENPETGVLQVEPRFFGKNYKPAEPMIGEAAYRSTRSRASQLKAAALQRDFTNVGGVTQTVLSGRLGGPVTVLMRNVGTYMPKGMVSFSGLRPSQGVDELIAVIDDIPRLTQGKKSIIITERGEQVTVSQYRSSIMDRFISAPTDGARALFIKELNKELARVVAYNRGVFNNELIDKFVDDLMENVNSVHGQLRTTGFANDPTGTRIAVNAITQRQLANSEVMLPFGRLDALLRDAARQERSIFTTKPLDAAVLSGRATRQIFEAGNKLFSLAQLYRFSYIPKNSILEPIISASMASGMVFGRAFMATVPKGLVQKSTNLVMRNIAKSKTLGPSRQREVQLEVQALTKQYDRALNNRDEVWVDYQNFFSDVPNVSPAARRDWADSVKADLRDAERIVDDIETRLNKYTVDYGDNKKIDVPSLYNLQRRIKTLEDAKDARFGADIANAKAAIGKAVGSINTLAPELGPINAEIAKAYQRLKDVMDEFAPKLVEQADLFSVAEGRYAAKRVSPEITTIVLKTGQKLDIPSMTNQKYLGDAYFSEIANTATRTMEFLGNKAIAGKVNRINRRSPSKNTKPTDPEYFGELVYIANNHMRGDILVDKILAGAGREELLQWGTTGQAGSYARNMGRTPDDITSIIDESMSYVNRYLPTAEAKRIVAAGDIKATDLQRELADKLDMIVPIQPLDIQYANPTSLGNSFNQAADYYLSKAWQQLGRPENLTREVWGNAEHRRITTEKLDLLAASGQEISLTTALSVRQAAAAEVVQNVSKTFYTIPRQHRALYMARAISQFPNANASGIYRYGRFVAKAPKRTGMFLNSYYALYNSFGVDKNGEPVDNPMDAAYLLVPGTKEMGFNKGKGIILSARSTNIFANLPGAAWTVPFALGALMNIKPDSRKIIKDVIDSTIGKIPNYSFDDLFPYGIETDPKKQIQSTFTPAWLRNVLTAFNQSDTDEAWMNSWASEANRQTTLWETGQGPKPTDESILKGAQSIYLRKARTQFFSVFGSPQYVDTLPDSVYKDYYYTRYNKYIAEDVPKSKIVDLIQEDMNRQFNVPSGTEFPMERLFLSAKGQVTKINAVEKSYQRIWQDFSGLARDLEELDPTTVSLMTADIPIGYEAQVNKFLKDPNTTLPGGTLLNERLKKPRQIEVELEKSRVWSMYTKYKTELNDAAIDANYASYRSVPGLVEKLDEYVEQLSEYSKVWKYSYNREVRSGDAAYTQSQGLYVITKNKEFMSKFGDTQFWQHAKGFLTLRDSAAKAYKDAPRGSKTDIQDQWGTWLQENIDLWDPVLQKLISRYFVNDNLKENN